MKPRNKFEKAVLAQSKSLRPITKRQMDWAFRECIDHYAYRLPKGRTTCMDCGHGWLMAEPSDSCTCPKCGARLKVRQTFERKLPQKQYFTVLTTSGEYQVLRKFLLVVEMEKGCKAKPYSLEIGQYWWNAQGRMAVVGIQRVLGRYIDTFSFGSPLAVRSDNAAYRHIAYSPIYPKSKVLDVLRRNGFDGDFHDIVPTRLIPALLSDSRAETLMKAASYRKISKTLDVLSPYEFVKLQGEVNNDLLSSYISDKEFDDAGKPIRYHSLEDYVGVKGVDWQEETFNPTWSQDHNFSLRGGSNDTQYNAAFSRYVENGIFNNSGFDKTTAKFRIDQKINKNISFNATINYALTNRKGVGTTADSGRFNMLAQILSARPTGGNKLTDEELLHSAIDPEMLETGESLAQVNPVMQTQSVTNNKRGEMWSGNASVSWQIIQGLTFKSAGTYNTTNSRTDIFYKNGSKEAYRNGEQPYGRTTMQRDVRWTNFNTLTWKQKVKKHNYDVMLGHEVSYKSTEYLLGEAMGFPFDQMENDNMGLGATPSKVESTYYDKTLLSFYARANYNYDNRYLFTATVRADGSTVFSSNKKWGFFPSFSAAWRVSEEAFMKDIKWISNFKIRLGWGTVGNDNIPNYLSLDLYEANKYGIGNSSVTVLNPKQLRNKNLKWEGSNTTNLGIDLGFFDNRLNLTAEFFIKNTKDLLLSQSLAHITGFDSQMQNVGKIQNKGIELSLNSTNIQTRNFTWQTNFNISFIRNTLKSLASGVNYMQARSGFDSNFTSYDYMAIVGQSLGLIYGYEFDGIYQYSDFYSVPGSSTLILKEGVTSNPSLGNRLSPGAVKYKDQDGDGVITTKDRTVIGNALPKWYGGITNTFNYKGIDFSFMLQFNYGNDIYNATRLYATQTNTQRRNQLAEVADRWSPTNASNKVPRYNGYVVNDVYSRFVEDGSFLRLKNITLGYTLPHKWTRSFHVSKLRVYATGQNLFCLNNYSGYDPEVSTASKSPMTPGLDWGAYPKSRVFTFGIDLQF